MIDPLLILIPVLALPVTALLRFVGCAAITGVDDVQYNTGLTITSAPDALPDGVVGVGYTTIVTLTGSGGVPPYNWTSNDLAGVGLQLDDSGKITGTPKFPYQGTVNITLTDNVGTPAVSTRPTLHIAPIPLVINGPAGALLPEGVVNVNYAGFQFTADRTLFNPVWSTDLSAASGLSINPTTGFLGGTPAVAQGHTVVHISLHDQNQSTPVTLVVTLNVLGITTTSLPNGQVNVPYPPGIKLIAAGAIGVVTWTSGPLGGLILDSDGTLHGKPTASVNGATFIARDTASALSTSKPVPLLITTTFPISNSGLAGAGSPDPNYNLIVSPDATAPGPTAFVVSILPSDAPAPAPGDLSKWIAPQSDGSFSNSPGDYKYEVKFDLTGLDHTTASITGTLWSDNAGSWSLNSPTEHPVPPVVPIFPPPVPPPPPPLNLSIPVGSGFAAGPNSLVFTINNAPTVGPPPNPSNPTGMRVEMIGIAASL